MKSVTRVVRMAIAVATMMAVVAAMTKVAVASPRFGAALSRNQIVTLLMQPPISLPFRLKGCGEGGAQESTFSLSPLSDSEAMK